MCKEYLRPPPPRGILFKAKDAAAANIVGVVAIIVVGVGVGGGTAAAGGRKNPKPYTRQTPPNNPEYKFFVFFFRFSFSGLLLLLSLLSRLDDTCDLLSSLLPSRFSLLAQTSLITHPPGGL